MTLGIPVSGPINDPEERSHTPVLCTNGAIASAHPLISATGLRVLADGGNAVDAAIAAALVGTTVLPAMCSIGGDLFALVHRPSAPGARGLGDLAAFHGSGVGPSGVTLAWMQEHGEDAPAGHRVLPRQGVTSPAVPGFIDGVFAMLNRFGTRSFGELAGPAIGYARDGFPLSVTGAAFIAAREEFLAKTPTTAAVFLRGNRVPKVGDLLIQSDLARTLGEIATGGPEVFYRGAIAKRMADYLGKNGGLLSAEDFAGHATDLSAPISTTYRNHTIYQTTLPTQGLVALEALNILEGWHIGGDGLTDATGIHLGAEAIKASFADRNAYAGDPRTGDIPLATLLSKEWAAQRRASIDPARAAEDINPGTLKDSHTTSLSVVDASGMLVSLIFSISDWFGSGVIAGDTGVLLNNRSGDCFSLDPASPNCFAPGKRPMHTLNCYLIAEPDGTPTVAGQTPGGDNQPQWNIQTITGLIDRGLDVQNAADQPRWMVSPGTYPAELGVPHTLKVESRVGEDAINDLRARGHRVEVLGQWGARGAVQVVARDPETGVIAAGSDGRSEGLAIGY